MGSYVDRLHDELAEWTADWKMAARSAAHEGPVKIPMVEILYAELQGRHTFSVLVAGARVAWAGGATREEAARECWISLTGARTDEFAKAAREWPVWRANEPVVPTVGKACCVCESDVTAERPGYWWRSKGRLVHIDCYRGETTVVKVKGHTKVVRLGNGSEKKMKIAPYTKSSRVRSTEIAPRERTPRSGVRRSGGR